MNLLGKEFSGVERGQTAVQFPQWKHLLASLRPKCSRSFIKFGSTLTLMLFSLLRNQYV
jgi:hypothetical protein